MAASRETLLEKLGLAIREAELQRDTVLAKMLRDVGRDVNGLLDERARLSLDDARSVIRADYWDDVRGVSDEIRQRVRDGEIADADGAMEAVRESIDGHQRVIYTGQAQEGLVLGTDNSGAYAEDFGDEGMVEDGDIQWSRLMYAAMERDVMENLGDLDDLVEELRNAEEAE